MLRSEIGFPVVVSVVGAVVVAMVLSIGPVPEGAVSAAPWPGRVVAGALDERVPGPVVAGAFGPVGDEGGGDAV